MTSNANDDTPRYTRSRPKTGPSSGPIWFDTSRAHRPERHRRRRSRAGESSRAIWKRSPPSKPGCSPSKGVREAPDSRNLPRSSDAPVARIVTDPEDAETADLDSGTTVGLDGTASTGEVETYEWQFGEGASFRERGSTTEITLDFCGTLDVTLRVTGPDGNQSTDTVSLSTDG
ncbi:PKD domain-containing protein [Haloferax sp. ATB1]|uniref:PKD domain-containing protein n=1 Tax=Haloferax sp. ATB1 TaxID=1508454 RepID=UPI000AFB2CBC|nr:PKD domain-containing protein [Haloferax sp. ATB1]